MRAQDFIIETAEEEAWELVLQPVPKIQEFVRQIGAGNDEQSVKHIASVIDTIPDTQLPAANIPRLKNLANKPGDPAILQAIQKISGRPDAAKQYATIMARRDAGESRDRGYTVGNLAQAVKSGQYESPVLLKLPTGVYVIGGRTRLYAALAMNVPIRVKIITADTFQKPKQTIAEAREANLYHGTHLANAEEILATDTLDPGDQSHGDEGHVSMTRDLGVAIVMAQYGDPAGVIFVLDQPKIAQRTRLEPFDWGGGYDEMEEISRKPIKNINRAIKKIIVLKHQDFDPAEYPRVMNDPRTVVRDQSRVSDTTTARKFDRQDSVVRERAEHRGGIDVEEHEDVEDPSVIWITASAHGRELGQVKFYRQGDAVTALNLEVKPEYRGQGIAKIMYDYAKEQGYKVLRSAEQTDAGYQFWERNRPRQGVWEDEMDENFADGKNPGRKGLSRRVGIPKKATLGQLEKIARSSTGERRRMAQWQLNMRRGRKKANEVKILSRVKGKGSEPGQLPKFGREIRPGQEQQYLGQQVGKHGKYTIWQDWLGGQLSYHLFDPQERRVIVTTFGSQYKDNPNSYIIHGLYAAPGNPVRAHEFYRALIRDLGLTLISDRKQSPGGNKVWINLERYPDVEIYGYDTYTGDVVNFGARDAEMYTVPSAAVKDRDSRYIANNLRLVATAR